MHEASKVLLPQVPVELVDKSFGFIDCGEAHVQMKYELCFHEMFVLDLLHSQYFVMPPEMLVIRVNSF